MMPRCDRHRRPRLRRRIGLTVLFSAGAGLSGMPVTAVQAAPPPGYTLFWSDEFHQGVGNGPDLTTWRYETDIHVNNELQQYVTDRQHTRIIADPQLPTANKPDF